MVAITVNGWLLDGSSSTNMVITTVITTVIGFDASPYYGI